MKITTKQYFDEVFGHSVSDSMFDRWYVAAIRTLAPEKQFRKESVYQAQAGDITDSETQQHEAGSSKIGVNLVDEPSGGVVHEEADNIAILPPSLFSATDAVASDVISFLMKPEIVENGTMASTDNATTFTKYSFMYLLTSTMKGNKMMGIFSIQASVVITVVVNASPFQLGGYLINWIPTFGAVLATSTESKWMLSHAFSLTQRMQLPHALINVGCDTRAQLKIPWRNTRQLLSYNTGANPVGNPGYVQMYPVQPLLSPSPNTCYYTMYAHFEDIKLYGMTVPQAGISITDDEQKGDGPLSSSLKIASKGAGILSKIPLISSYAKPVKWAVDLATGVASAFGLSKPVMIDKPMVMWRTPFPYLPNANSFDNSAVLCLKADNQVEQLSGFGGSSVEETSISFLKQIRAPYNILTWDSATGVGNWWSQTCTPGTFYATQTDGNQTVYSLTPIAYLASIFSVWRGSIKIHITIFKTQFHSGRLEFVYVPFDSYQGTPTMSSSVYPYAYRTILDVRDKSEWDITIPYISTKDWTDTADTHNSIGSIRIDILTPLIAPTTVNSKVYVMLEFSGGEDMEFAIPASNNHGTTTSLQTFFAPYAYQSGIGMDPCEVEEVIIGGGSITSNPDHKSAVIGENCSSLLDLLKRGGLTILTTSVDATHSNFLYPRVVNMPIGIAAGAPTGAATTDVFSMVVPLYGVMRGAVRLKLIPTENNADSFMYFQQQRIAEATSVSGMVTSTTLMGTLAKWAFQGGNVSIHAITRGLGGTSVQTPHYGNIVNYSIPNSTSFGSAVLPTASADVDKNCIVFYAAGTTIGTNMIYRSVGDDFQLGGFTSIPPVFINTSP